MFDYLSLSDNVPWLGPTAEGRLALLGQTAHGKPRGQIIETLAFSEVLPIELIHQIAVSSTIWRLFVLACAQPSAVAGAGGF